MDGWMDGWLADWLTRWMDGSMQSVHDFIDGRHAPYPTNIAPAACWTAILWQPADPHPLSGTEVGCKVGCQWVARGWSTLSLLFYPLVRLCAY